MGALQCTGGVGARGRSFDAHRRCGIDPFAPASKEPRGGRNAARPISTSCPRRYAGVCSNTVVAALTKSVCFSASTFTLRQGTGVDVPSIKKLAEDEKMVVLDLAPERCIIAEGTDGEVLGAGQLKSKESGAYMEISTVVVQPKARRQGVGTSVVNELLKLAAGNDVYLTTVDQGKEFFKSLGFTEVGFSDMPMAMRLEWAAGNVAARISINQRCMVMLRKGR
ncbi:unnamed protein product [Ostreobium quekettii]|uniref:N-acetyltransferase domain-containing protein n=1 Tax=Ostreobium quekettii TaxID=121088 RepID=A0A8S1J7C6_9CHLO|nr:unnamed protein product [Ostreobium quekettii]